MIKKENLDKTSAWPFVEAKKMLRERKSIIEKKGKITLQTGYGPSGLPHIGTFGEVARTSMIVNALKHLTDVPAEIITFSDDMDGLRKVPDNVPNKKILLAGVFLGFHFALFFRSVQLTSIAEAALLGTVAPVFTEFYSIMFQKKRLSIKVLGGLFLALLGAYTLLSQSSFSDTSTFGNVLAVLCSAAMAVVLLVGKDVRKSVGLFEYSRWLFFYAAACLLLISLYQNVNVFSFSFQDFGWFVFLAAIPTMVGHNIFYFLVKTLSATTVAAVPLGEPVISSVGAFFLFNEPVGPFVFLGGSITLIGVYIIIRNDD